MTDGELRLAIRLALMRELRKAVEQSRTKPAWDKRMMPAIVADRRRTARRWQP